MPIEVSYHLGDHALLGAGHRWLLLDVPLSEAALLGELWDLITSPGPVQDQILGTVAKNLGTDTSLVWVDTTPGAQSLVCWGAGRCSGEPPRRTLWLGGSAPPSIGAPGLRVASGIVPATVAVIGTTSPADPGLTGRPVPIPLSVPAPTPHIPGLIDGIPPEVLASVNPNPTPTREPAYDAPEPDTGPPDRDPDHDGNTTLRADPPADPPSALDSDHDGHTSLRDATPPPPPSGPPNTPPPSTPPPSGPPPSSPPPPSAHLSNPTHETVLAVHCPAGHSTPAAASLCRVCQAAVPDQEPHLVPRPRLGHLRLPDGQLIPLDRAVLFGRSPSAPDVPGLGEAWPHLVRLPSETSFVSRTHLLVELKGWLVLVTDLGSRGGTTLRAAGRAPERIRAREHYVWEPGQVFDLADSYEIVYEVTR
ncbi:hypothetical protein GCM10027020_38180 [Nocardioides salsibiostraticola]